MKFILVGQPNCGKSTIFNETIGYQSICANFPGATVQYTSGFLELANEKIEVIDLPGTYSIYSTDEAELETAKYLLFSAHECVIINMIDSSVLSRSLELTLQLMELQIPMVIGLNMIDEAKRKGIEINDRKLEDLVKISVVKTIGRKGIGVADLFRQAYQAFQKRQIPPVISYPEILQETIEQMTTVIDLHPSSWQWPSQFLAIKILEDERLIVNAVKNKISAPEWLNLQQLRHRLEQSFKQDSSLIVSSARHHSSFQIFEKVATIGAHHRLDLRQKIDDLLLHPFWGYIFLIAIIYTMFQLIFYCGSLFEPIFLSLSEDFNSWLTLNIGGETLYSFLLIGLIQGITGGAIVIPYLLIFFIILSFLEDTGYLTRIAYLIDNMMHHIGLHGTSIIPLIIGYGCTVPGIMATRILKSPRDKFITSVLTTLVPCSARMTVILALVGFFISPWIALAIYVINLMIVVITGKILSKILPEVNPGFLLEIPPYHIPQVSILLKKTWFRIKEFIVIAWPLLILGSLLIEISTFYHWDHWLNQGLTPLTSTILGFPATLGTTLLFGILRKELAMLLLFNALNTQDVSAVLSVQQIFNYTLFVTLYIPCLATVAVLAKELSWKKAIQISIITFLIAVTVVLISRLLFTLFTY